MEENASLRFSEPPPAAPDAPSVVFVRLLRVNQAIGKFFEDLVESGALSHLPPPKLRELETLFTEASLLNIELARILLAPYLDAQHALKILLAEAEATLDLARLKSPSVAS